MHPIVCRALSSVVLLHILSAAPASAQWEEGVAAFKKSDFQTAARLFQSVVDQDTNNYQGQYMLGVSLQRLKRHEEAIRHLKLAHDLAPQNPSIRMSLASSYNSMRRYGDVVRLLADVDASALPSRVRETHYKMRASARQKTGDRNGALIDFQNLAKLLPNDPQSQLALAAAAQAVGREQVAREALEKAVRLDGRNLDSRRSYIQLLVSEARNAKEPESKKLIERKAAEQAAVLASASQKYEDLMLATGIQLRAGLWKDAESSARQAAAGNSGDWLARYYLGQALSSSGKFDEAEQALQSALPLARASGDQRRVWKQLGFALELQKKFREASEAYRKAGDAASEQRMQEKLSTAPQN